MLQTYPTKLNIDDRVYYRYDGDQQMVMIGSYHLAKELYASQKKLYRDHSYLGHVYEVLFKECIGTKYGDEWLAMKKPLDSYFSGANIKKRDGLMDKCIECWFNKIFNADKIDVNLGQLELNILTMKFLVIMTFEKEVDDNVLKNLLNLHEKVTPLLNSPIRYGIKMGYQEEINITKGLYYTWVQFINDMGQSELISHLLTHKVYDERKIIHTLYELIMFNADVMINAITHLIWDIGSNVDVQKKLADVSIGDAYLNKVVIESARLHPGVVATFTETSNEALKIGGYIFPKSTLFSMDTKMINTDPTIWDDPTSFNPDRYTEESIHKVFRFGLGQRRCIGRMSTDTILKKVITKILSSYQIRIPDEDMVISGQSVLPNFANGNANNMVQFIKK